MGKLSPPSIKYVIHVKFTAEGVVEKPDVIGAVFGQTEGLLGEEMDLRELQKKGKIGRIDANCEASESKTTGTVEIPTSIDKSETTIIAAAVETIDRIGPCLAKFEITSIEDVRTVKREYVMERAKKLLEQLNANVPEMKEMQKDIITKSRTSRIIEYGEEKLPAGPSVEESSEIIVVEGRADVVNLLGYGIKNAIAMNGTSLPKTIKELSREKQVTLFVDGDRGGVLMIKDAVETANIVYITQAPDGKEVEELTEKEILICLRNRMPAEEFLEKNKIRKTSSRRTFRTRREYEPESRQEQSRERETQFQDSEFGQGQEETYETVDETDEERQFFQETLNELRTREAAIIVKGISGLKAIYRSSSSEIVKTLYNFGRRGKQIYALVIDDAATLPIIRACEKVNCRFLVARNFANIRTRIKLISL